MSDDADEVAELKYEAAKWKRAHDAVESKLMEVCEESVRLQAKVERLTKAGIAMGMALPDTNEANAAYSAFERVIKS